MWFSTNVYIKNLQKYKNIHIKNLTKVNKNNIIIIGGNDEKKIL